MLGVAYIAITLWLFPFVRQFKNCLKPEVYSRRPPLQPIKGSVLSINAFTKFHVYLMISERKKNTDCRKF